MIQTTIKLMYGFHVKEFLIRLFQVTIPNEHIRSLVQRAEKSFMNHSLLIPFISFC